MKGCGHDLMSLHYFIYGQGDSANEEHIALTYIGTLTNDAGIPITLPYSIISLITCTFNNIIVSITVNKIKNHIEITKKYKT